MAKKQTYKPIALLTQIDPAECGHMNLLNDQFKAAKAALDSFGVFLSGKYSLVEGDSIKPDGQIVRKG